MDKDELFGFDISLDEKSEEYFELDRLRRNIKSNKEMSLDEIKKHTDILKKYINSIVSKTLSINEKHLEKGVFLVEYCAYNPPILRVSLNFTCKYDLRESDISFLRRCSVFDDFFKEERRLLEKELEKEYLDKIEELKKGNFIKNPLPPQSVLDTTLDYSNIPFKNLNDLNCAKFLDEDEKRMILGLKPRILKKDPQDDGMDDEIPF
jgi:hypothetical protein